MPGANRLLQMQLAARHTCAKAGLPMDFWKQGRVLIEAFTAEVFSEKEI